MDQSAQEHVVAGQVAQSLRAPKKDCLVQQMEHGLMMGLRLPVITIQTIPSCVLPIKRSIKPRCVGNARSAFPTRMRCGKPSQFREETEMVAFTGDVSLDIVDAAQTVWALLRINAVRHVERV